MKKLLLSVLFAGSVSATVGQVSVIKIAYEPLKPAPSQAKVQGFITQFLSNYHFQKFALNDEFSSKVWDNVLADADRSRVYFTKPEIEALEKYRYGIDEAVMTGDLAGPFEVYNLFRQKYKQRHDKIVALLQKPFDFTKQETIELDREKAPWAANEAELDEIWRKIIKNQALAIKMGTPADSGKVVPDSIYQNNLRKRYEMFEKRIAKWRSEDVFQNYMNSFTEVIDPHTNYMKPSMADQFNIDMSQSLEGIGASLQNVDDYVVIKDIIPGGPLFKSNAVTKESKIVAVAQGEKGEFVDIVGWLTDDAVKLIRGKKGTTVRLRILPASAPATAAPKEVVLVRDKIKLEEAVATGEVVPFKHNGKEVKLGIVDIPMFYRDFEGARRGGDFSSTTRDVRRIIEDFQAKGGVDGVVIDLRNNGGGSLTEAIDLTGLFIANGPVVQRKSYNRGIDVEVDRDNSVTWAGPLVILQNRFSASASEIFAGAVQDYKRGVVVGENSFGKGTVQQLVDLDQFLASPRVAARDRQTPGASPRVDGFEEKERYGQLKITTEKFYRITGNSTQRKGVAPDIAFPTPFEADEMGESSQPTALPYDEIQPTTYTPTTKVNDRLLKRLQTEFEKRTAADKVWKQLKADFKEYQALKEEKTLSLNKEKRAIENDQSERLGKSIKRLNKTTTKEKHDDDIYFIEAQRVLADMIQ